MAESTWQRKVFTPGLGHERKKEGKILGFRGPPEGHVPSDQRTSQKVPSYTGLTILNSTVMEWSLQHTGHLGTSRTQAMAGMCHLGTRSHVSPRNKSVQSFQDKKWYWTPPGTARSFLALRLEEKLALVLAIHQPRHHHREGKVICHPRSLKIILNYTCVGVCLKGSTKIKNH